MNKNNITHPENMNTEDTKKEMTPSAHPNPETLLTLLHLHLCETEKA